MKNIKRQIANLKSSSSKGFTMQSMMAVEQKTVIGSNIDRINGTNSDAVKSSYGFTLPEAPIGKQITIKNTGSNKFSIYSSLKINDENGSIVLDAGETAFCTCESTTNWLVDVRTLEVPTK